MGNRDFKRYASLLEEARRGNNEAFHQIYLETYKSQIFHLKMHLKNPEEIKDALQEVYFLLFKNLEKIDPPTVLLAYLNRLSYFVGKNMAKKLYRRDAHTADFQWMEFLEEPKAQELLEEMEDEEQLKLVKDAVLNLPDSERSVIFMRYYQKMTQQEVAISLGLSRSGVKYLQNSAYRHMKELLRQRGIAGVGIILPLYLKTAPIFSFRHGGGKGTGSNTAAASASVSGAGISTGLCAAGVFAALVGGSSLTGAPDITSMKAPDTFTKAPAGIEVRVDSPLPVNQIWAEKKGSAPVYGHQTGSKKYVIYLNENGSYKIKVKSNNGRVTEEELKVKYIDSRLPEALVNLEHGRLYVSARDEDSGIDFDDMYCDGEGTGRINPVKLNAAEGTAEFELPEKDVVLHLKDKAGNRSKIPISYEEE